jgi:hypothetical protein
MTSNEKNEICFNCFWYLKKESIFADLKIILILKGI